MRLIDADTLLENFLGHAPPEMTWDGYDIEHKIDESPTVDAAPVVHGRWIDRQNSQWKAYLIRYCSICDWSIHHTRLRKSDEWRYCPNCGAKMDGGESNETD